MKTLSSASVVARLLINAVSVIVMIQLVGCQQTGIQPLQAEPAQTHITNPMPKPTVICLDCIDGDLPHIDPQLRVTK